MMRATKQELKLCIAALSLLHELLKTESLGDHELGDGVDRAALIGVRRNADGRAGCCACICPRLRELDLETAVCRDRVILERGAGGDCGFDGREVKERAALLRADAEVFDLAKAREQVSQHLVGDDGPSAAVSTPSHPQRTCRRQ